MLTVESKEWRARAEILQNVSLGPGENGSVCRGAAKPQVAWCKALQQGRHSRVTGQVDIYTAMGNL